MAKRNLLSVCLIGLLAFGGYKWFERDQAFRRQQAALQASEAVQQALEKQVSLDILGPKRRLSEVLKYLEDRCKVRLDCDVTELKKAGVNADPLIHVPAATVSLRSALQLLLEPLDLVATPRDGALVVTTPEVAGSTLTAQLYRLPQGNDGADIDATGDEWHNLIRSTVFPQGWDDVGGPAHIEAIPGALMMVANEGLHHQIRELLAQFAAPPPVPSGQDAFLHFASAEERRIYAALSEKDSVFFDEMPLVDAMRYFSQQHGIPIQLASKKLEEAAVPLDTPVTRTLRGISLRSILKVILDDLELTYVIRDSVLLITTPEDAEWQERVVVYDVRELVEMPDGQPDFDPLSDLITSMVSPQSWDDGTGPGPVRGIGSDWIVFSQSDEIHEEVAALLAGLRERLSRAPEDSGVAVTTVFPAVNSAEDAKVRQALERTVDFEFEEVALQDVCSYLAEDCQINVLLNAHRLEDARIRVDTPINCKFRALPLRTALGLALEPLDLVAVPYREMLVITTIEHDEWRYYSTRIYDTRHLSGSDDGAELADLCKTVVHPESWGYGGPGDIGSYRGLLVVRQSEDVHRDLESLFRALHEQLEMK